MLQSSERRWRRESLLSRRTDKGSSLKWTPRASPTTTACDSSKENEHAGGARSSAGPAFAAPERGAPAGQRIYVDVRTLRAMETELERLPLPATRACVGLALRTSAAVLEAHAAAVYARRHDDDAATKEFEILGSILNGLSLSPAQRSTQRRERFREACQSLVPGGNKVLLKSWKEAKRELAAVFAFSRVDIDVASGAPRPAAASRIPTLPRRLRPASSKPTPKRAHRRSPKKERPQERSTNAAKRGLSLEAFREQIMMKMGAFTFRQVFHQGGNLTSEASIAADAAARLDDRIRQKEAERRSTTRVEAILAAKAKADQDRERAEKEREARESAAQLMRPLTPEEQGIVNAAVRGIGPETEILARQDADSVQRGSMQTLEQGSWLNDEVINYFLKNCLAKRDEKLCAKQPGRKRSHFFNSFFVQTLFDEKNHNSALRGKYNYKNVKRWGKKVPGKDVFDLKCIVCPINLDNVHWTSAVIFVEEKRIQYYDSMGGRGQPKLEGLLRYLQDEHRAKKGTELDVAEWTLVPCSRDTPRQSNGVDCGVFTCMFCDFLSKDCPLVFDQAHIAQCRERIALSIMKNCAIE